MQYDRETVEELNKLSLAVFGTKSKWKKMIDKGVAELVEEDATRLTIENGKESKEKVKTPLLHKDQLHQYSLKYYTVSEVREFLLMVLERRTQVQEAIKKIEEQQKVAKQAAANASGTAV